MSFVNAVFLFIHVLLTYCYFINSYTKTQLDFVIRHISSNLILEDQHMNKFKPNLLKYILVNKFPSNALSVF